MVGFSSLTHDILSDVFITSTYSSGGIDRDHLELDGTMFIVPSFTSRPSVLSRVCKHWRRVALSTSRLWSQVIVLAGHPRPGPKRGLPKGFRRSRHVPKDDESYAKYWNMVITWLKRSGGRPLKLYVQFYPIESLPLGLLEAVARCDIIHLVEIKSYPDRNRIINLPVNAMLFENAKRLQRLEVDLEISAQEMGSIVSCLPNLKYLRTTSQVSLNHKDPCPLESLSGCWGVEGLFSTIPWFPNVRTLEIDLDNEDNSSPPSTFFTIRHLTNLTITGNCMQMGEILPHLELPSLQLAEFVHTDDYCEETVEEYFLRPLANFLKRNPSKRIALRICGSSLKEAHAMELLRAAPYLTNLDLALVNLTNNGLRYLTCGSQQALCPNLLTLTLSTATSGGISVEHLTNMINSRLTGIQDMSMALHICIPAEEIREFTTDPNFETTYRRFSESSRLKLKLEYTDCFYFNDKCWDGLF